MFRPAHPPLAAPLLRPIILFFLVLVLAVSTAPDASARTISRAYFVNISGLPRTLCVGQSFTVRVYLESGSSVLDTNPTSQPNIAFTHQVGDPNLLTITPPRATTRRFSFFPAAPTGTTTTESEDDLPNLPQLHVGAWFTVEAKKPGKTYVLFLASVPTRLTHRATALSLGGQQDVEVINCNYNMRLNYFIRLSDPLGHTDSTGTVENIKLKLDPNTFKVTGRGDLPSQVSGGWETPLEECADDPTTTTNRINVGGALQDNKLELKVYLLPSLYEVIRRCKQYVPTAWRPLPPQNARSGLFTTLPTLSLSVPEAGDTVTLPLPYPPQPTLTGEFNITIEPEQATGN